MATTSVRGCFTGFYDENGRCDQIATICLMTPLTQYNKRTVPEWNWFISYHISNQKWHILKTQSKLLHTPLYTNLRSEIRIFLPEKFNCFSKRKPTLCSSTRFSPISYGFFIFSSGFHCLNSMYFYSLSIIFHQILSIFVLMKSLTFSMLWGFNS